MAKNTQNGSPQGYIGAIKNSGVQFVKAPHQSTYPKKASIRTGTDLRTGKGSK